MAGIGVVAATTEGQSVSTRFAGSDATGSTTGVVGTFDGARGGGCCEDWLELCFETWLLNLITPLC